MKTMTRVDQSTVSMNEQPVTVLLALELGDRTWKLGFTTGIGQRPRVRQIPAGAVDRLLAEVTRAKVRLGVPAAAPVVSCYEAGRDGFWLHRSLMAQGVTNHVVDSSSIEVPRRARRAKTDKLDLASLLRLLARYLAGDRGAWRLVRVPSVAGGAGAGSDDGDGSGGGGVADGEGDRPDWDLGLGDGDLWLAADTERPRARGAGDGPGPLMT